MQHESNAESSPSRTSLQLQLKEEAQNSLKTHDCLMQYESNAESSQRSLETANDCHSKVESKDILELKSQFQRLEKDNEHRDSVINQFKQQLSEIEEALLHLKDREPRHRAVHVPGRPSESVVTKDILQLKLGSDKTYEIDQQYTHGAKGGRGDQDSSNDSKETPYTGDLNKTQDSKHIDTTGDSETLKQTEQSGDNKKVHVGEQTGNADDEQAKRNKSAYSREPETRSKPLLVYRVEEDRDEEKITVRQAAVGQAAETIQTAIQKKEHKQQDHTPQVISQKENISKHELYWEIMFSNEMDKGRDQVKTIGGVHTVVCVDISESMAQDGAWAHARRFFMDFINGLNKMKCDEGIDDEHVALVTFGHETRVVKPFTNKFEDVRASFDSIKLGGPSPFYGGLKMAIAAAGSSEHQFWIINSIKVDTKIVIITDGKPTPKDLVAGPDEVDYFKKDEITSGSLQIMEDIAKYNLDFFCVPVGKADMEFLDLVVAIPNGKRLQYTEGERFSRRTFLTHKVGSTGKGIMGMLGAAVDPEIQEYMARNMPGLSLGTHGAFAIQVGSTDSEQHAQLAQQFSDLNEEDLEQMKEITERAAKGGLADLLRKSSGNDNKYQESDSEVLPPIGTRVRRGPDWSWHTQDNGGPGTVIGHIAERSHIWVAWDADDESYFYHYGGAGRYDVLPVDEPRRLGNDGVLKVGCVVKPGKDWKDTRAQQFDRGVVIRLLTKDNANIRVRWNNGTRGDYAHNFKGKCEVQFSPPFDGSWSSQQPQHKEETTKRKNKNKNKNAK